MAMPDGWRKRDHEVVDGNTRDGNSGTRVTAESRDGNGRDTMTNRFSNQITGYLLVGVAILGLVPSLRANVPGGKASQNASGGNQNNPGVLPPRSSFHGNTYSQWSENWWLWAFSLPVDQNPITTNGAAPCSNGQTDHVWFLVGVGGPTTIHCTVPPGTALFFPIVNTECSSLESFPFHGGTPEERSACAKSFIDAVTDLAVIIDGKAIHNLTAYRVQSGDFDFTVPADNILTGGGPDSGQSSADGYYLLLAPLSAGTHTIRIVGATNGPFPPLTAFSIDTTYVLTVGR
jgi:hypothetical protein